MTSINIRFLDFWGHFDKEGFLLTIALRDVCNRLSITVNIVDENIEYQSVDSDIKDIVVFSVFGESHWFVPDSAIKIFYTGENICPDFNACDYALGFEWLNFGDRYLRLPNYLATPFFINHTKMMEGIDRSVLDENYAHRDFCSFVVSNGDANPIRQEFFDRLNEYKRVDSGGRYLNNVGGPVDDKIEFCRKHKFTIAFENSSHPGYTTEKIVDAFAACSVPIYWGDPEVTKVFNPKAFINVNDYFSVNEAIDAINEINCNNELYMSMLHEKPYVDYGECFDMKYSQLVAFTVNIVQHIFNGRGYRYNRDFFGRKYVEKRRSLLEGANNISIKDAIKRLLKW